MAVYALAVLSTLYKEMRLMVKRKLEKLLFYGLFFEFTKANLNPGVKNEYSQKVNVTNLYYTPHTHTHTHYTNTHAQIIRHQEPKLSYYWTKKSHTRVYALVLNLI